jgi:hypothetical protein
MAICGGAGGDRQAVWAQDNAYLLTFRDHRIDPAELQVPAGVEFKLVVKNADATPEEFESESLELEKIIAGGAEAEFTVGPLEPGDYEVFGEFHEATAQGKLVAK